ncbi:MAG: hypothetical protein RIQ89_2292 [Bacteroidota bacterium]|jgi:hypothetical protein
MAKNCCKDKTDFFIVKSDLNKSETFIEISIASNKIYEYLSYPDLTKKFETEQNIQIQLHPPPLPSFRTPIYLLEKSFRI